MGRILTQAFYNESDAVVADVNSSTFSIRGAQRASLFVKADLGGTTPSIKCTLQTQDALGNWHDVGSGVTLTTVANDVVGSERNLQGPFGDVFRIAIDVDVASGNETYQDLDVSVVFEYDPAS